MLVQRCAIGLAVLPIYLAADVRGWLPAQSSRPSTGASDAAPSTVVEIRSYNLKPGTRDRFHQTFLNEALPMLRRWNVDVVAYGPSLHDADSYFLMRGFPSVGERQRSEDAFYGSEEWRKGPREAILADIDSYTTIVVAVDAETLRGLRATGAREAAAKEENMSPMTASSADLATLMSLNDDYVRSVLTSDVKRFDEILADDFLCSLPDGSLIDRARFLSQTNEPSRLASIEVHDVNVRLLGEFAIIHARTTFTTREGRAGSGRYTDVWAKRGGRWLAISAHVTRK